MSCAEKQRHHVYLKHKEENSLLTLEQQQQLHVDDLIDVKVNGEWIVGKVLEVKSSSSYVTVFNKTTSNEWFNFNDNRIANLGTFTNGKVHKTAVNCTCTVCVDDALMNVYAKVCKDLTSKTILAMDIQSSRTLSTAAYKKMYTGHHLGTTPLQQPLVYDYTPEIIYNPHNNPYTNQITPELDYASQYDGAATYAF
jgi:hypothetical protein